MSPDRAVASASDKGGQTMSHLLSAAERLFAERGFHRTSIRDIVQEAGSNIAAVNYHFGSKENLYREVFRRHRRSARATAAILEVMERADGKPDVESVLEAFARAAKTGDDEEVRRWWMLIHHELMDPSLAPRFGLKEIIDPLQRALSKALASACPRLSPKNLQLCVHSFLAQLAHLERLQIYFRGSGVRQPSALDLSDGIRHVVRFTSAGIRALEEQEARGRAPQTPE